MVWDWTSPRHDGGPSFSGLAAIKFNEQPIGGRYEVFVPGQIVRRQPDATGEFRQHFGSVMFGQCVELLEQSSGSLRHNTSLRR
jgi:hypothetical protein